LSFGVAPCTALLADGPYCYQQWGGCLAPAAFNDEATIKWRFMKKAARAMELYATAVDEIATDPLFMLESVSVQENRINVGAIRMGDAPLGITGGVTISFTDEPFDDHIGDPYLDLRPEVDTQAGFWAKFFTRVPYFAHIRINIYEGFWGDSLDLMTRRTYIMESATGPDSNQKVTISGVDPLRLTDPKRASFPPEMDMELVTPMTNVSTSDIIVQKGITGDLEIQLGNTVTKYILIGKEVIGYTGQSANPSDDGEWTLTGITRANFGTTAAAHAVEDAVQRVARFETEDSYLIAEHLLAFTRVPPEYVNAGGSWTTEASTYLQGYQFSRTVIRPTPVNKLLGELMRDSTFYLWWNAFASEVKMKAIRPEEATIDIDDDVYLRGSFSVRREPKERISRVHIRFGQRDPTEGADFTNYAASSARIAAEEEYEKAGAEVMSHTITSDWIITKAIADEVNLRLLARFSKTPMYATLRVVGEDIVEGDLVNLTSPALRDTEGFKVSKRWQVISAKQVKFKEVTELTLQEFIFQAARYLTWMPDDATATYEDIPVDEREGLVGVGYWSDDDGLMSDGSDGWFWQ
jgi:hypothetical protein